MKVIDSVTYSNVKEEIECYRALVQKDNWDGYGAVAFKDEVFDNAFKVLDSYKLNDNDSAQVQFFPNGTIAFDWNCVHGAAFAEVGISRYVVMINHPDMTRPVLSTTYHF